MGLLVSTYTSRFGFGFLNDEPEKVKEVRQSLNDEVLPRHLAAIERTVDPKIGPWLAGQASPTVADFSLVYALLSLTTGHYHGIDKEILKPFPNICAMIEAFERLPVASVEF